jgi:hypothetical protein
MGVLRASFVRPHTVVAVLRRQAIYLSSVQEILWTVSTRAQLHGEKGSIKMNIEVRKKMRMKSA